ncbi:MAG: DUF1343 domain-containing protein [Halanaerobiales bacterium]|nr:DUF1343 domain-containing protein [Halanaerobiales bacterium]
MAKVKLGIEALLSEKLDLIKGRKVGLITNYTGMNSEFVSTVELLYKHPEVDLRALFGPEHGIRGEAQAGEKVTSYTDSETGLPVYSLYGKTKKPTDEMLEGLDTLIFDIQDVGVRFYTFINTMSYAMEKAKELGLKFIVLDRPNPIRGDIVDGNILDLDFRSFVGIYPILTRHGMTIGELALLFNDAFKIGADLSVVSMDGWKRSMWYDETKFAWIAPSLGLPTLDSTVLYTGLCFLEGTNVSEGRGTTLPFQVIGAPWVKGKELADELNSLGLAGIYFRPTYFKPLTSKHQGQLCQGVQIHLLNKNQFIGSCVGLNILAILKRLYSDDFQWYTFGEEKRYFIDLLWGTDQVRKELDEGLDVESIQSDWKEEINQFQVMCQKYLLYE